MFINEDYLNENDISILNEFLDNIELNKTILKASFLSTIPIAIFIYLLHKYSYYMKSVTKEDKKLSNKLNNILNENNWKVYVIEDKEEFPSAFCAVKKDIFINIGLKNLLNERELIAVLLHEAYHIKDYHVYKDFIALYPIYTLFFTLFLSVGLNMFFIFILFIISKTFMDIPLNIIIKRKSELKSDSYAVKYGYGNELISTFKKLENKIISLKQKQKCDNFCQIMRKVNKVINTHPSIKKRIENILKKQEVYKKKNIKLSRIKSLSLKA